MSPPSYRCRLSGSTTGLEGKGIEGEAQETTGVDVVRVGAADYGLERGRWSVTEAACDPLLIRALIRAGPRSSVTVE